MVPYQWLPLWIDLLSCSWRQILRVCRNSSEDINIFCFFWNTCLRNQVRPMFCACIQLLVRLLWACSLPPTNSAHWNAEATSLQQRNQARSSSVSGIPNDAREVYPELVPFSETRRVWPVPSALMAHMQRPGHAVHFAKCCDFPRSSPIEFGQSFFIVSIYFGDPKFVQMVIRFDITSWGKWHLCIL